MKQFAIIGLDNFGLRVLEELLAMDVEVLIVDKDEQVVAQYRNQVAAAYVADAINEETIRKIIPPDIDAVVIDLGDRIEASILVAHYLKKMGVKRIVAKAETDEHGEILELVGVTDVIFPDREAAKRIMPPLLSESMFSYMPISDHLVMAEVKFPAQYIGQTVVDANIRSGLGLNVIAVKPGGEGEFIFITTDYQFKEEDRFLVVGSNERVGFVSEKAEDPRHGGHLFRRIFRRDG
jgi:trk system potassium uptake protein TrkA